MTDLLGKSYKIDKSNDSTAEFYSTVQYMSPADESIPFGGFNACPFATLCKGPCLGHASGRMRMAPAKQARINRTLLFKQDKRAYGAKLIKETNAHIRKAEKLGRIPAERLNGCSDILWENVRFDGLTMMERYPNVVWYDYTKWPLDRRPSTPNYHLTFSRSERTTLDDIQYNIDNGRNVAVVFDAIPTTWEGWTVIDGDADDMRWRDPVGVIVGLKAKGDAIKDTTGFVVRLVTKVVNGKIVKL